MTRYDLAITALNEITRLIASVRERYPAIKDSRLELDGAIHYANGNDGTIFDWSENGRTCEFYVYFAADPKPGFIKCNAYKDGEIVTYVYPGSEMEPAETIRSRFDPEAIHALAYAMYYAADDCGKFDKPLDDLDWTAAELVMGRYPAKPAQGEAT